MKKVILLSIVLLLFISGCTNDKNVSKINDEKAEQTNNNEAESVSQYDLDSFYNSKMQICPNLTLKQRIDSLHRDAENIHAEVYQEKKDGRMYTFLNIVFPAGSVTGTLEIKNGNIFLTAATYESNEDIEDIEDIEDSEEIEDLINIAGAYSIYSLLCY